MTTPGASCLRFGFAGPFFLRFVFTLISSRVSLCLRLVLPSGLVWFLCLHGLVFLSAVSGFFVCLFLCSCLCDLVFVSVSFGFSVCLSVFPVLDVSL